MTTINPNGVGAGIARTMTGTAIEVRWKPELVVTIDGAETLGVQYIEYHPAGELGNQSSESLTLIFQGSPTSPRSASVSRLISGLAICPSGDGFTATLVVLS